MRILRSGLLLLLVGMISSVLLGYVYSVTREIISKRQKDDLFRQQKEIFPTAKSFVDVEIKSEIKTTVVQLYQAFDEKNKPVGYIGKVVSQGYGGEVVVLVGITPAGYVERVRILKENETPGLGKAISQEKFLRQFSQKFLSEVYLTKDSPRGKIVAITGASRSSRAVVRAVGELGNYLESAGLILRVKNATN